MELTDIDGKILVDLNAIELLKPVKFGSCITLVVLSSGSNFYVTETIAEILEKTAK